jgi:CBS domain-containing protein
MPATKRRASIPLAATRVATGHPPYDDGIPLTPGDHVGKLVNRSPVCVLLDTTLPDIALTMAEESIGVVLVRAPHVPAGIVSERDLALAIAEDEEPGLMRARDVMTPDLACIGAEESILSAADVMLANEIRHLVVMSGPVMMGLVSMRDVVRVLAHHAAQG